MDARSLLAFVTASAVVVVSASACSTSSGTGSSSGGSSNDGGSGETGDGGTGSTGAGQCGSPFINHPECGAADSTKAPFVQCKASAQAAPEFVGGTPPADGTYYLTDCTDYANDDTPPPSATDVHLAYKFAIVIAGSVWAGSETSCTTSAAFTDKFTFTANVQPDSAFIALDRTCGNGFVSGSPYKTTGNTITVTTGAGQQGETVVLTFAKQ